MNRSRSRPKSETLAQRTRDEDTRNKLKNHARRLFSERGIENVAVRDILEVAGQRNIGAIGYYFGSKESLVREIMIEGAILIDQRRNALLDELESVKGTGITVRDIVWVIVHSAIDLKNDEHGNTYVRLFANALRFKDKHPLFLELTGRTIDPGFWRCVAHLRRLLPEHSCTVLGERIYFSMLTLGATLSLRESALERQDSNTLPEAFGGRSWSSDLVIDNLIDACEGILCHRISAETSAQLPSQP